MSKFIDDMAKLGKLTKKVVTGEVTGEDLLAATVDSFDPPKTVHKCGNALSDGATCILNMGHEGCVCPGKGSCNGCTFEAKVEP